MKSRHRILELQFVLLFSLTQNQPEGTIRENHCMIVDKWQGTPKPSKACHGLRLTPRRKFRATKSLR